MSRFAARFIGEHYALMRHTKPEKLAGDSPLDSRSVEICRSVIGELAAKVRGQKVSIYHSPISRAEKTAAIVQGELAAQGISVLNVVPLEVLKFNNKTTNDSIRNVLSADHFTLFITHQPTIEHFLGEKCNPANNTIVAQKFIITGNSS